MRHAVLTIVALLATLTDAQAGDSLAPWEASVTVAAAPWEGECHPTHTPSPPAATVPPVYQYVAPQPVVYQPPTYYQPVVFQPAPVMQQPTYFQPAPTFYRPSSFGYGGMSSFGGGASFNCGPRG